MENRTLLNIEKGMSFTITDIPAGLLKAQLIRLGICAGEQVSCLERLPGGTIVVKKNRQEIAIGKDLAREICVKV